MKLRIKKYLVGTSLLTLCALLASFFYTANLSETRTQRSLYMTLAAEPLPNESSSYELQRAAEHFSDLVLGWTVEPSFNLDVPFTGRRQEKQNLLFLIETEDEAHVLSLLESIESRIETYNLNSGSSYVIADFHSTEIVETRNKSRINIAVVIASLLVSFTLIFVHDTFTRHRR